MMKFNNFKKAWYALLIVPVIMISSCKEDDPAPVADPVASFQFEVDATDFLKVTFTNFSTNATTYAWDFGDGVGTSTDKDPVYSYSAAGTYSVKLTATNSANVSKDKTESVIITDPLAAQRLLIGADGKDWYLIADNTAPAGVYAHLVGPTDRSAEWWSLGGSVEYCVRTCLMDDVWTFNTDGTYTYDNNGDYYGGKGSFWNEDLIDGCFDATVPEHWIGKDGQDLSAWNSATHPFVYDVQAGTITVTGGGFIGLQKAGTDKEYSEPQPEVIYTVAKLVEGTEADTLVVETLLSDYGYWASTLVSYHDIADQVVTEECPPPAMVTFILNFNDYVDGGGTAVTPEVNGTFNGWCGSCWPMTDDNGDGIWELTKELEAGDYRFKFSADGWGDQEDLAGVTGCTVFADPGTDRTLTVVSGVDMTLGPVCWASCDDCL